MKRRKGCIDSAASRNAQAHEWAELFDDWLAKIDPQWMSSGARRPLKNSTKRVYREMWLAFAHFCEDRGLGIASVSGADIENYFQTRANSAKPPRRALSTRYAWRMLHLIDRLLQHHAEKRGERANLAASALLRETPYGRANGVDKDQPPVCLSDQAYSRLISHLVECAASKRDDRGAWKRERDRAAIAMMLAAGLTSADLRGLKRCDVTRGALNTAEDLRIPAGENCVRVIPLAPWAGKLLAGWLRQRESLGIAGEFVFPSVLSGKQWSHTGCQQACRRFLDSAGVSSSPVGLYSLRHTFALHHLRNGVDEHVVASWLGHRDRSTIAQYRPLLGDAFRNAAVGEQL